MFRMTYGVPAIPTLLAVTMLLAVGPVPARALPEGSPRNLIRTTGTAAWIVPVGSQIDKQLSGDDTAILVYHMRSLFDDLRWAATAWKWTYGVPPRSLQALQDANLLLRIPLQTDGTPYSLVELTPEMSPGHGEIGIIFLSEGLEVVAANPDPEGASALPLGRLKSSYAKEWAQPFPHPPVPIRAARAEALAQVEQWLAEGQPLMPAGNLARSVGGNLMLWSGDQLNERRLLCVHQAVWDMMLVFAMRYGRLPTDWAALCDDLRWQWTGLQHLEPGGRAPVSELALASQVADTGQEQAIRLLLKPTADVVDPVIYRFTFIPATGEVKTEMPDDYLLHLEDDWQDLLRISLPTDPDPAP